MAATVTILSNAKVPNGPRRLCGVCVLTTPDTSWAVRSGMVVQHATATYKAAVGAALPYYAVGTGANADVVTFTASTDKTLSFEIIGSD